MVLVVLVGDNEELLLEQFPHLEAHTDLLVPRFKVTSMFRIF
jgi:hypothetical protein